MNLRGRQCLFVLIILFLAEALWAHNLCSNCSKLIFKENKNQYDSRVLFKAELPNSSIFLCADNFTFLLADTSDMKRLRHDLHRYYAYKPEIDPTIHLHAFRSVFENANTNCEIIKSGLQKEYYNYYQGSDPKKWASKVRAYEEIEYKNIYSGIDLNVSSELTGLKYYFSVKPGASHSNISVSYEGVDALSIEDGRLVIRTSVGDVIDSKPYAYQNVNGKRKEVACSFVLNQNKVSFSFPGGYDKSKELIIDPTLIFSTFSGSTADNFGYSATYDSKGEVYAAGSVFQFGQFPITLGAFQTTWAGGVGYSNPNNQSGTGTDIAITKYDSAGTQRIFSTYLGGRGDDLPHSLVVNKNDELFVFGTTASNNFPVTANAYDTSFNGGINPGVFGGLAVHYSAGSDIIITRFKEDGTALVASTYLGGSGNDGLTYPEYSGLHYNYADEVRGEIDIDRNNNVYIATCTRSSNFPTTIGAYQTTSGGLMDGVIVKLDNNLTQLIWSTYIGGNDDDAIYSVAFDGNDDLYVSGGTQSTTFPVTSGVIQNTNKGGRADGFITHISKSGNQILHSTYYGSSAYDQIYFVETSKIGNVYVLGQTEAVGNTFIYNAAYNKPNSGQFISKLKPELDSLIWSTAFGRGDGNPDISPTAFLVDVCNKMYVSGWGSYPLVGAVNEPQLTTANLDVTPNAYQSTTDGKDFYVMVLEDDASAISYATYFGSPNAEEHVDGGTSRFDRKGIMYQSVCAGCGGVSSFPTTAGAVSQTNGSYNCNNAVFKFDLELPLVAADFTPPPVLCGVPYTATFSNTSKSFVSSQFEWTFGDGETSQQKNPVHTYLQSGTYTVQLVVTDITACNYSDTIQRQIVILQNSMADTLADVTGCINQAVQIGLPLSADTFSSYTWTPANTLSDNSVSNPFANPQVNTVYQLLVSSGFCIDTFYQKVNVFSDTLQLTGSNVLCAGDTLQLHVSSSKPTQQYVFSWQPISQIIAGANTISPTVSPSQNTTYIVTATNSQYGCVYMDSIKVNITSSLPGVNAFAVPDTISIGDTSQINLTLTANVIGISWQQDATLSAIGIANPMAYPRQTHSYYVEVSDSNGCRKRDTVTVIVINTPCAQSNIYIPNAFSPNGDERNDVFYVRGNYITKLFLAVYDRWGQKMFETQDISKGWDGTFKGKKLDPAVFGYYLEGECESGEKFFKKGNVTLLR